MEQRIINRYIDLDKISRKEVNFKSKLIEWSLPLYNLGTCVCQETFPLPFKTFVDDIAYDSVENGITVPQG